MPYINVSTSAKVSDKGKLLEEISILISSLTNKSRSFVMAKIDDNCQMYFDDETPSCFLEIKSIGSLNPSEIGGENISNSGYLQLFINDIRITRIYSDWVHVPQRFFNLKENFIKITIHSYLHDQFTIKGKPIEHIVKVIDN